MAQRAVVDLDIDVRERDVDRMLSAVNTMLQPLQLMGFLSATISPYIRTRARDRFRTEGDEVSGPWAPLRQATQDFRAHSNLPIAPSHPINRRTDDLFDYITNSPDAVMALPGVGAQLTYPGNPPTNPWTAEKVKTAQGGKTKPKTVARPVLGLGMNDLVYVVGALTLGIKKVGRFL